MNLIEEALKHIAHRIQGRLQYNPDLSIIGTKLRAYGIDLSHWEPEFNPASAALGLLDFCIIKATEGTNWKDVAFETLYPKTLELLANGAYHYLRSNSSGVTQANYFMSVAAGKDFDILAIDFEGYGNTLNDAFVRILYDCLVRVTQQRPDCKVVLYTNPNLYDTIIYPAALRIWGRDVFKDWDLWIAQYYWVVNPDGEPSMKNRKDWKIWQISDAGKPEEHGTTAYVDRDVFNGTLPEFKTWLGLEDVPPDTGGTMEDLYYKVNTAVLNIRSSAASLGSTNDLGDFNLALNDVVHTIEKVISGTDTFHQIDKIWRNGVQIPFTVVSPTNQYWAAEKTSTGTWMTVTTNPQPTQAKPVLHVTVEADGYPKTQIDINPL